MHNESNPYDAPQTAASASTRPSNYSHYTDVPWYRRSGTNSVFTLLGLLCFSPLLWFVCIVLMTGDIYYDKHQEDGTLKTWSFANKVIAWILLVVNLAFLGFVLFGGALF